MGFMGSGKSTLGQSLSEHLGLPFTDLDRLIESSAGKSIPQIFSEMGEPAFREMESESLKRVLVKPAQVIAIGGGAPCREDHIRLIRERSTSVYLKISVEELFNRLWEQSPGRPLIAGKSPQELRTFIASLLRAREPYYTQANIILESDCLTAEELLQALLPGSGVRV